MTKKLTEMLDLFEPEDDNEEELTIEEVVAEAGEVINALEVSERVDHALQTVDTLNENDIELDDIAKRALKSYENLCDMGVNMQDNYIARIYEVANSMLKVALDAREAKVDRKLKTIELQMKKMKMDEDSGKSVNTSNGAEFDRNEILKAIRDKRGEN